MEKALKQPSLKSKVQKVKAKFAAAYYGNPSKDMKVIAVTGANGKATVARFVQEILKATDPKAGLIEGTERALTPASLQKQMSKSWRAGANHVVVAVSTEDLRNQAFDGVPLHMVVMADSLGAEGAQETGGDYDLVKSGLFEGQPEYAVLNYDDPYFEYVEKYPTKKGAVSYGNDKNADTWVSRTKLYKKGAEATLTQNNSGFDVATYMTGEEAVPYMAAAATAGLLLGADIDAIVDGIASYEP
ncbi:MAG: Mur ligase family protein [Candidatus Saccharimonadales bacterium]